MFHLPTDWDTYEQEQMSSKHRKQSPRWLLFDPKQEVKRVEQEPLDYFKLSDDELEDFRI